LIHRVEDGNTLGEQGGSLLGTFDLTDTGLTQAGSPLDAMAEGVRPASHRRGPLALGGQNPARLPALTD